MNRQFTKYNNPNKRKHHRKHSPEYIESRKEAFFREYVKATDEKSREAVKKAYHLGIND